MRPKDSPIQPFDVHLGDQAIRGTIYSAGSSDRRRPTVILLHGFTGTRIESDFMFVSLGRGLAEAGIHAVTFDFRGSGESDGAFDQMLIAGELADALCVYDHIATRPGVDRSRIGLLGFSLGGLVAACASARRPTRALALLAPTTTDNLRRRAETPRVDGKLTFGSHTLHPEFFIDLDRHDPLGDVVKSPRPTLIVQGTADKLVTPEVSSRYARALEAARVPCQAEPIADANHTFTGPAMRRRLAAMVIGFFQTKL